MIEMKKSYLLCFWYVIFLISNSYSRNWSASWSGWWKWKLNLYFQDLFSSRVILIDSVDTLVCTFVGLHDYNPITFPMAFQFDSEWIPLAFPSTCFYTTE